LTHFGDREKGLMRSEEMDREDGRGGDAPWVEDGDSEHLPL
jgi:hypothetical protein